MWDVLLIFAYYAYSLHVTVNVYELHVFFYLCVFYYLLFSSFHIVFFKFMLIIFYFLFQSCEKKLEKLELLELSYRRQKRSENV